MLPTRSSEEIRAWALGTVPIELPPAQRALRLREAMTERWGLGLQHRDGYTGTASEVFESRVSNCLSFAFLFTTLARELGIATYYVSLDVAPRVRRHDTLRVRSEHVAVGVDRRSQRLVVDFAGVVLSGEEPRELSDLEVLAMFYANRGAELLLGGREREAIEWLEDAVVMSPHRAASWLNLGVARRRTGDLEGAAAAYERALEIDGDDLSAKENLALLRTLRRSTDRPSE